MTSPFLTIAIAALLTGGGAKEPVQCPVPVQGAALTCCATSSGQSCCAQTVTSEGLPLGCACAP